MKKGFIKKGKCFNCKCIMENKTHNSFCSEKCRNEWRKEKYEFDIAYDKMDCLDYQNDYN